MLANTKCVYVGTWAGHLAGGRLPNPTWASNPQYMLSTQQRSHVMISLIRSDLRQAILPEAQPPEAAIGITVVKVCAPLTCAWICWSHHKTYGSLPFLISMLIVV